jgi:hypothetical protein
MSGEDDCHDPIFRQAAEHSFWNVRQSGIHKQDGRLIRELGPVTNVGHVWNEYTDQVLEKQFLRDISGILSSDHCILILAYTPRPERIANGWS